MAKSNKTKIQNNGIMLYFKYRGLKENIFIVLFKNQQTKKPHTFKSSKCGQGTVRLPFSATDICDDIRNKSLIVWDIFSSCSFTIDMKARFILLL